MFHLTATLAAFLACGAVASRQRKPLRFALAVGSLCVVALLLDQVAYYRWHQRVERLVSALQQDIESGSPAASNAPAEPDAQRGAVPVTIGFPALTQPVIPDGMMNTSR